jgi:hypothetical protein
VFAVSGRLGLFPKHFGLFNVCCLFVGFGLKSPPNGKHSNVKCNIFSELTQKASLLFFRKKINGNCNRKILRDNGKLKPNFVLKILFGKILCEIKNWNQTLRKIENRTKLCGLTLRWFFSSWKYNTAFNSGLH